MSGRDGSSLTCDKDGSDHYRGARVAGAVNVVTGIALIATYVYGVWDGVAGYRQRTRELAVQLFMTPTTGGGGVVGLGGQF